jgi:hypothetical protein
MLAEIEDLPRQLKQETNKGKTSKEEHLELLMSVASNASRFKGIRSRGTAADLCEYVYQGEAIEKQEG